MLESKSTLYAKAVSRQRAYKILLTRIMVEIIIVKRIQAILLNYNQTILVLLSLWWSFAGLQFLFFMRYGRFIIGANAMTCGNIQQRAINWHSLTVNALSAVNQIDQLIVGIKEKMRLMKVKWTNAKDTLGSIWLLSSYLNEF